MTRRSERKLAAIIHADVVGYSRLMSADEEATIDDLNDCRKWVIDPLLQKHGGRVANTAGDSLLMEFASAVDAVRCALEMQQQMADRNKDISAVRKLEFRVGINVGDVVTQGTDLLGDGVNVAARLQSVAEPGCICISGSVHDQIAGKLKVDFIDLGELSLKNIERPIRAYSFGETKGVRSDDDDTALPAEDTALPFDIGRFKRLSIIVMPFKDLGGGNDASLAEGLRLSLHSILIKLPGFFLLHPGVVERFRGQQYSSSDVGREIDVRYVVAGAVQRAGDRVRVTVELTDTVEQEVVWGETYNRVLNDVFDLQDEVASEIVDALDVQLRGSDVARLRFVTISNPSAREYFHRGISHLYQGDRENSIKARQMLEKVEEFEPNVPTALAMIAFTHWRDSRFGWSDDAAESLANAARFAQRAVDRGDPEGVGRAIMSYVHLHSREYDKAMALSVEAVSQRPSCPLANGLLAEIMRYCGNPSQSISRMKEAMKLARAFPPWMIDNVAASLRDIDQVEASISTAKEGVKLFADNLDVLVTLCCDYEFAARRSEAETVANKILATDPSFTVSRYANRQPYKDETVLKRIVESLQRAGLPA